jgi:RHS repeat-associated protein
LFGNGVDQIEADESNGNVLWALTDHLGSVRDVVDDSGTVLNHIVYDAFGGVTSQTDESVVFKYGYTAREFDAESGLQYNRARYLDTFTGKFISEDPISFQGGDSNLYRYVFNSPLNGTDPSGLQTASEEFPIIRIPPIPILDLGQTLQDIGNGISEAGKAVERFLVPPAEAPTFRSNPQSNKNRNPSSPPNPNICPAKEEKPTCKTLFPHLIPLSELPKKYIFRDAEEARVAAFPNGKKIQAATATKGPCSITSGYEPGTHWNVKSSRTGDQLGSVGQCNVCVETPTPHSELRGAVLSSEPH